MKKFLTHSACAALLTLHSVNTFAGSQTDAGLTLLEPAGARAAALGEAFASMSDDITAFGYNPASLQTMKTGQASFLFQRGLGEDSFGQLAIGNAGPQTGWGISFGYYNSGSIDAYDGTTQRAVTGQRDMNAAIGFASTAGPFLVGFAGKYFSSELGETAKASTFAADAGLHLPINSRLRAGASVQNFGGQLKYVSEADDLPRLARLGFSWLVIPNAGTSLLVDGIYRLNQKEFNPAFGVETVVGPLALRAGYKAGSDLEEFTLGTGFIWNKSSLDYTFGFADELSSSHRISLSTRFGASYAASPIVKKKPETAPTAFSFQQPTGSVYEIKRAEGENPPAKIYFVRDGDTLKSIAQAVYGREEMWQDIYRANQHLLANPENFKTGQKIILPARAQ